VFGRGGGPERLAVPVLAASRRLPIILFMALSLIFVLLDRAQADVFDEAREAITDVTTPIFEALSPPIMAIRDFFSNAWRVFDVYDENARLRDENQQLLKWKETALRLEHQNSRYEALLNVKLDPSIEYVTGRVVSDTGGPFVQMFIINIGKRDGVRDGQAVIDEDGLVGKVLGAGHTASRVLMLSDLNSRVPILVEPSNYKAVLVGDNAKNPSVRFLPQSAQVQIGDRVVTSGDGGELPPGLPVGVISEISSTGEIRVQTFSRDTRVERVRILAYEKADPDQAEPIAQETLTLGNAQ
jgi:rod shape-determining protein MreC